MSDGSAAGNVGGMATALRGYADPTGGPESAEALTVLVTAGASAPENLVAGVCRALLVRFGGTIESRDIVEEDVEFGIPATLKRLMRERGIDPSERRIRVSAPAISAEAYGAVPITIAGRDPTKL